MYLIGFPSDYISHPRTTSVPISLAIGFIFRSYRSSPRSCISTVSPRSWTLASQQEGVRHNCTSNSRLDNWELQSYVCSNDFLNDSQELSSAFERSAANSPLNLIEFLSPNHVFTRWSKVSVNLLCVWCSYRCHRYVWFVCGIDVTVLVITEDANWTNLTRQSWLSWLRASGTVCLCYLNKKELLS